MISALQIRKLTRLFALYDVNGNGVIERDDYQLVAQSTAQALGYAPVRRNMKGFAPSIWPVGTISSSWPTPTTITC